MRRSGRSARKKIKELAEQGKTMLIVSHNLGMVKDLCDRGVVLRKGKKIFDGPVDEAIKALQG